MLNLAFGLFVATAVIGLLMAGKLFIGQHPHWFFSLGHAALGLGGVALVIVSIVQGGTTQWVLASLLILCGAALGGFYLASHHVQSKIPAKAIVTGHGLFAVVGLMLLGSTLL